MFGTEKFEGVRLTGDSVTRGRDGGPLSGASATVETITHDKGKAGVGRAVLTGGIGVMMRKRYEQKTYLTISGPTFSFVVEVDPKQDGAARKFAAKVNDAARKAGGGQRHGWTA